MQVKIAKTYPNGATIEIVNLTPGEELISKREIVYHVRNKAGDFLGQFGTTFDASEAAQA